MHYELIGVRADGSCEILDAHAPATIQNGERAAMQSRYAGRFVSVQLDRHNDDCSIDWITSVPIAPRIGLNVLCQGATHPKSGRPTHPALAEGGPAKLLEWIKDKLKFFPAGAPVIIRIPGGWMPEDGPIHLLHQLAIGKPIVAFLDEFDEWHALIMQLKVMGHPVHWADAETLVFLRSDNARHLLSRHGTKSWDAELAPLEDWNCIGDSSHERIHVMVEEDNENGVQARDTAMQALGRGSTVYINPDKNGKKWGWTPAQMVEVAARVYAS